MVTFLIVISSEIISQSVCVCEKNLPSLTVQLFGYPAV